MTAPEERRVSALGVLVTGAQAGAADEAAVAAGGSWDGLLAAAGAALASGVLAELRARGGVYGRRVLLVAGRGDNGGDAWVAARRLADAGVQPTVLAVHGCDVDTSDHAARARAAHLHRGGRAVDGLDALPDGAALDTWLARFDVGVDAVLGTGIRGAPRDTAARGIAVLERLRTAIGRPVVACDVPSGVDAATGQVADPDRVVTAARTVTFGAAKRGLVLHPGAVHAGAVEVAGLGPHWDTPETAWRATDDALAAVVPPSVRTDKRSRGRVVVVAGSRRYGGAAALCAAAAVRAGAGLVTCATTAPATPVLAQEPGVMVSALPADEDGFASPAAAEQVRDLAGDADVVVLGPGCGHGDGIRALAEAVLGAGVAVVLDADGINVFRDDAAGLLAARAGGEHPLVLTPHHRELARLLGGDDLALDDAVRELVRTEDRVDPEAVLAHRHAVVPAVARALGATVVGKGPGTVVASPDGRVWVTTSGGPALGTGGSGDVLAGMLGPAVAQAPAATAGAVPGAVAAQVHRHGRLGERAGAAAGGYATAHQLLVHLPALLAALAVPA